MNKQELIEAYERISSFYGEISVNKAIENLKQLDEPTIYVKNILARLRELPLHDREVWLKAIMGEFEQDFSHAKWREGYEQGKFEGAWVGNQLKDADKIRQELNKPVVPQFVADWYEKHKNDIEFGIWNYLYAFDSQKEDEFKKWFDDSKTKQFQTLVNMHQFGYEVEKEKRYKVTLSNGQPLVKSFNRPNIYFSQNLLDVNYKATKKELQAAGFGWVFGCPGIEIEEVEK
ncbi:DUF1642 domain-containing protein [Streptococcus gordonii]|uniref:DUF1642 domain-containing protein n=1 Tax=Streptococcus gordonii TaxID=1302 RepID=UPI001CC01A57|nr:DUF1642 domain-containing protein [Streptococcus gordonii]MBZ2136617.1 DUF1642 domain-containing protein [Streptococcus gordonii]